MRKAASYRKCLIAQREIQVVIQRFAFRKISFQAFLFFAAYSRNGKRTGDDPESIIATQRSQRQLFGKTYAIVNILTGFINNGKLKMQKADITEDDFAYF
jgi:hypothetical protein